ncbi:30S ribosomal protein S17 [Candidatus Peribacteria bacterium]|nr:MAG: 30S ribosomal protein S17 [Candidatus Peribacteria bacterium]
MITKKGIVTSAKMTGTVTVTTHRQVSHPLYKKSFRRSKKFLVDLNKMTDVAVGDEVLIEECKPLSKNKHFLLKEVLKRVPRVGEMSVEKDVANAMTRKATDSTESTEPTSK